MARRVALLAFLFLIPALAKADDITTYTYVGPAPANLSGSFTTATPLVPGSVFGGAFYINAAFTNVLSWKFTDGVDTWTPANSTFEGGAFVNPDGTLLDWSFQIGSGNQEIFSQTALGAFYYQDHTPVGDTSVPTHSSM